MSRSVNAAWNLEPNDGKQFAKSSFTIEPGQYAEITALQLCAEENIVIVKISRPVRCSDLDPVGHVYTNSCGEPKLLNRNSVTGRLGSPGEYVIAREVSRDGREIYAPKSDVRVEVYTMKPGLAPLSDSGFCTS